MTTSYREYVEAQVQLNPCFLGLKDFLKTAKGGQKTKSGIYRLEYLRDGTQTCKEEDRKLEGIVSAIATEGQSSDIQVLGRILFIEDIEPQAVELLGSAFDVNPLFFATYLDTTYERLEKRAPPPTVTIIPSRLTRNDAFHIHWQRGLSLGEGKSLTRKLKAECSVLRAIKPIPPLNGVNIGLARTCCSIWLKKFEAKPWLCACVSL